MWLKIKLIVDFLTAKSTSYLTFTWFVWSDFFPFRRRSSFVCLKYQFRNDIFDRHLIGIFEFTFERAVSKNGERNESKSRFDRNDFGTISRRHRCVFVLNSFMTFESEGVVTCVPNCCRIRKIGRDFKNAYRFNCQQIDRNTKSSTESYQKFVFRRCT